MRRFHVLPKADVKFFFPAVKLVSIPLLYVLLLCVLLY